MSVEYDLTDLRTKLRHAHEDWRHLQQWLENQKAAYEVQMRFKTADVIQSVLDVMRTDYEQ